MLMACRNLVLARDFAINLEGEDNVITKQVEAGKKNFGGFELPGRTLGVVGLGAIGVLVANAAVSLGMRVIGFDPLISVDKAWELDANVEKANDINQLLQESDFITFHVPLVEATKDLINETSLQKMKDNVVILNFARNGIVNDEAVCKALDTGKVYSYVCDFPSNLLNNHNRVIALPHLGASTGEAEENCAIMVANEVRNYLENGTILNSVNMPMINLPRAGDSRLSMIHENIPDMVGQVSHILGKAEANIIHMVNNSRDNVAVTLMDVEAEISEETQTELSNIAGMLKLRVI
jgi:D-3-phosphoglycerate dehydrogenase